MAGLQRVHSAQDATALPLVRPLPPGARRIRSSPHRPAAATYLGLGASRPVVGGQISGTGGYASVWPGWENP